MNKLVLRLYKNELLDICCSDLPIDQIDQIFLLQSLTMIFGMVLNIACLKHQKKKVLN